MLKLSPCLCSHRKKEEDLQALLGLSDERVSARYGRLAQLFGCNIPGLKPRLQLLLELTGGQTCCLPARPIKQVTACLHVQAHQLPPPHLQACRWTSWALAS